MRMKARKRLVIQGQILAIRKILDSNNVVEQGITGELNEIEI